MPPGDGASPPRNALMLRLFFGRTLGTDMTRTGASLWVTIRPRSRGSRYT